MTCCRCSLNLRISGGISAKSVYTLRFFFFLHSEPLGTKKCQLGQPEPQANGSSKSNPAGNLVPELREK